MSSIESAKQKAMFLLETKEQRLKRAIGSRVFLIKIVAVLLFIFSSSFPLLTLVLPNLNIARSEIPFQPVAAIFILVYIYSFFAARKGQTNRQLDFTGALLIGSFLCSVTLFGIITKLPASFPAAFIVVPVLVGVVGLPVRVVTIYTIISGTLMTVLFMWLRFLPVIDTDKAAALVPELISWVGFFVLICSGINLFIDRAAKGTTTLEEQTNQLYDLLQTLNSTTGLGSALSRQLSDVTAELNQTSQEQSANTQELVAAVNEVTVNMEELGETATQIATNAGSAAGAAESTLEIANRVKDSSQLAESTALEGSEAVDLAVGSVNQVRNRIELLGQRLLNLTEQTRRVGNIIDIIDEIADETHLLALNASIEAAGNITTQNTSGKEGEVRTTTTTRGERFGVIAQEIKGLSDRSREATEEVRQAISEMQGAVAAAVLVAEEGKKETSAAVARSEIAGAVINKLNEVIATSADAAEEILNSVATVRERCDEISLATSQQRSANQQILLTMRGIAQVSQQSAGTVAQLSDMVGKVNNQIDELNRVMTSSVERVELVAA